MNLKLLLLILISALFAVCANARDGRVDYIAEDGRFVIFGDYEQHYKPGDSVQIRRDEMTVGAGIVISVYPTYMMMRPAGTGMNSRVREGDLVERVIPGVGVKAIFDEKGGAKIARIDNGGNFVAHGDLGEIGFLPGALVEILREGKVIGAAEVIESGNHLTRMKLVGTTGVEIREGDSLRVPEAIVEQVTRGQVRMMEEEKPEKKKIKKKEDSKIDSGDEAESDEETLQKDLEERAVEEQEKEKEEEIPIEKRLHDLNKKK